MMGSKDFIFVLIIVTNSISMAANKIGAPKVRPHLHIHHFSASGPAGYTPDQIRKAYRINLETSTGAGQTIALIEGYGSLHLQSDFDTFNRQFGLPHLTLKFLYPQGKPAATDSTWALETCLDVEWAHAIAPGAEILVVVAADGTYANLLPAIDAAVAKGAQQISMSWGSIEWPGETAVDAHFNVGYSSFFASSGDSGAGLQYPAASPYVIGVGGTTLTLNSNGYIKTETAWLGSGGGVSVYETVPSYQTQAQGTGQRTVPDMAYDGDPTTGFPVYDSNDYGGSTGWFQIGGTSAGAPQWAALSALANSFRDTQQTLNTFSLNTALYSIGGSSTSALYIRDTKKGCDGTGTGDCASVGYDFVTGLGSPIVSPLIKELRPY